MDRRNLPFSALRAFEAAARHASVTGAAQELAVTHSAVSHQIKQLERQLGTSLFLRTNRGLQITAEGEMLLPVLAECFDRISTSLDQIHGIVTAEQIHVTCTPSFATKWLVPRLGGWYANRDACRIHLQPRLEFLDFNTDNIDLAIRCGVPPWPGLEHELLMPIHLIPVCNPDYAAKHKLLQQPADALNHDLIHADVGDHGLGEEWGDWLAGCGLERPQHLHGLSVHDPALAMQAAADGLGIAIGYRELIERDLNSGNLITAYDQTVKHEYSYYLVYKESMRSKDSLQRFKTWLVAQL